MKKQTTYTFTKILVTSFRILTLPIWFPIFYFHDKWELYRWDKRLLEHKKRDAEIAALRAEREQFEKRRIREMNEKRPGIYKVTGRCDKWWRIASGTIVAESIVDVMRKAQDAIQDQIDTGDVFTVCEIRFIEPLTDPTISRKAKFRCIEAPTD